MKNRIAIRVEFHFKGKRHAPGAEINLDDIMERHSTLPPLHDIIAEKNGIDSYSHEYDVMLMEDVRISHAEGFVSEHILDGVLDIQGFERQWLEMKLERVLQAIADKHLHLENLDQHAGIRAALLEAYRRGESSGRTRPRPALNDFM